MQRAPAANRHGEDGSVPVAELLHRRPGNGPVGVPPVAANEPILCPERPAARAGALIGVLALFAALLCAATAAISTAITRPFDHRGPHPVRSAPVEGAAALRPDLLDEVRWPFNDVPGANPPAPVVPGPSSAPPGELVRRFCTDLGTDPDRAVADLAPELVGDQGSAIAQSWRPALAVRCSPPQQTSPDTARTEITAEFGRGMRMAVQEEFRTANDRIGSARLLGASLRH